MNHRITDEVLVQEFIETRQVIFFNELYRRYYALVLRHCQSFADTTFEAEDMTQEIFLRVFSKLELFRYEARFSTWLHALIINYGRDRLRQSARLAKLQATYQDTLRFMEASDVFTIAPSQEEQDACLNWAFHQLSEADQGLLHRKYIQQEYVQTIAQAENSNLSAVKMRLLRARNRFRRAYKIAIDR